MSPFPRDGQLLAVGDSAGNSDRGYVRKAFVKFINPSTGNLTRELPVLELSYHITSLDFSPDGKLFAVNYGVPALWDVATGKEVTPSRLMEVIRENHWLVSS